MKRDLLIIMTKYTLILAPLEVFAKRTFLGQGPETAALPDPEQWIPATFCRASILYIDLSFKHQASSGKLRRCCTYESKKKFGKKEYGIYCKCSSGREATETR